VLAKLVQTYDNAQLFASVDPFVEGAAPEQRLLIDIRAFSVSASPTPGVEVALAAKLLSADGKVVAQRLFRRSAPIATTGEADAVAGLSSAFAAIEADLVAWTPEARGRPRRERPGAGRLADCQPRNEQVGNKSSSFRLFLTIC